MLISCSETCWTYWLFCTFRTPNTFFAYFTVKTKAYIVVISHTVQLRLLFKNVFFLNSIVEQYTSLQSWGRFYEPPGILNSVFHCLVNVEQHSDYECVFRLLLSIPTIYVCVCRERERGFVWMDFSHLIQTKLKNADKCLCISFYEIYNLKDLVLLCCKLYRYL